MRRYLTGVSLITALCLWLNGWGIISEGRSPNERPDWWKQYENAKPIQPSPKVEAPQGSVPTVVEEAATRSAPAGVPDTLVVQPQSGGAASRLPQMIDSAQVMEQATRDIERKRSTFWRPFALFGGFLLLGGGAVFGILRWLSQQVPEPPRTRRRRY
ncbi:MAG: hypothetical protein NZL85_08650 [Fimbriimonadales bacterium]|nr:hypothetical protein [Fimbriimonadales bacterium]